MEKLADTWGRAVNHGTFLHIAHEEGLIRNTSIHAGIRAPLYSKEKDLQNDKRCGFELVRARDIDRIGVNGVIQRLRDRVAGSRVYISVDIDVLDPAFAPGQLRCSRIPAPIMSESTEWADNMSKPSGWKSSQSRF